MTHEEWIRNFEAACEGFVRGRCAAATAAMVESFPELRRVAGFAHWAAPNGRQIRDQHWWCVDAAGAIVDPTAAQFTGPVRYEELDLGDPETLTRVPTGRCMGCGGDVYDSNRHCSDACEAETFAEMGLDRDGRPR